jgi:hypothetical protein
MIDLCIFALSGEAESGSAGEQPARINLTDWNGQRRSSERLILNFDYSGRLCLIKLKQFHFTQLN